MKSALAFKPLTPQTWKKMESLFGEKGACGGCWCMWWRLQNKEYELSKGKQNKETLKSMVYNNSPLGILAIIDGEAIGWCSVAPRTQLRRLETSRIFKPIDDVQVWSITCIFIEKEYRKMGLSIELISAASEFAFGKGAKIIEAYPIIPQKKKTADVFGYVGFVPSFEKAGFKEAKKASEKRLIMRKIL